MSDLLKRYDVVFSKQKANGRSRHVARGGGLAEFLDSYTDQISINEGLESVDYNLNGGAPDYDHGTISSELYTAWLNNDIANIYPSVGNTENLLQSIPLKDFRNILTLWKEFLKN
jgi:hypothetical protein